MKSDRNREIPVKIERSLWGISAGRCEFEGCNYFLGINPITMETGNYGEKAHIEAVSNGGARYREVMDVAELNSTDNLIAFLEDMTQECCFYRRLRTNCIQHLKKLMKISWMSTMQSFIR